MYRAGTRKPAGMAEYVENQHGWDSTWWNIWNQFITVFTSSKSTLTLSLQLAGHLKISLLQIKCWWEIIWGDAVQFHITIFAALCSENMAIMNMRRAEIKKAAEQLSKTNLQSRNTFDKHVPLWQISVLHSCNVFSQYEEQVYWRTEFRPNLGLFTLSPSFPRAASRV